MFSMPAAGLDGPLKDIRTYGLSLTSTTGLDSLTGYVGGGPIPVENAFSDPYNGIMGAFAILVALQHRDRTGEGQHIDYSQQEAVMQMVGPGLHGLRAERPRRRPPRQPSPAGAPPLRTASSPAPATTAGSASRSSNDSEWRGLVAAMGEPEWAAAAEFADAAARVRNIDALHERIAAWTPDFDDRELAGALQAARRRRRAGAERRRPAPRSALPRARHVRRSRAPARLPRDHLRRLREDEPDRAARPSRARAIGQDNEYVFKELLGCRTSATASWSSSRSSTESPRPTAGTSRGCWPRPRGSPLRRRGAG